MDSRTWWYILKIKPHACNRDILECRWINEWDLYIKFANGDKFIYDTYTDYFRVITYDRFSITEAQWKNEFKERLKSIMERKQINQEELAMLLGSSQQMISRYCTGSAMPSNFMIHKIAIALGCDDNDLLYQEY